VFCGDDSRFNAQVFSSFRFSFGQDRLSNLRLIDTLLRKYDRRATPTNKIGKQGKLQLITNARQMGKIKLNTRFSLIFFVRIELCPDFNFAQFSSLREGKEEMCQSCV
jgi:hypothetical protein